MTAFLSREQEFHKINEHLNNMTKCAVDKPPPPPPATKNDSKFATYTKKGPITVFRSAGIKPDEISLSGLKEKNSNTVPKDNVSLRGAARKKPLPTERPGVSEGKKHYTERSNASPPLSLKTLPSTRNSLARNTSNIVVRYKNASFIQSPSLEVLVRGENESLRSHPTSRSSDVSGVLLTTRPKANLSSEGLVKYLKSRITILQGEHETLIQEMANQKELVEKSVERQKKIECQRDTAYARNNTLSEQMTKLESQLEESIRKLKDNDAEHHDTKKELETTKRELKMLTQTNVNLEKRLYRTNEELENLRNSIGQMKNVEKEIKDSVRSETESHEKQIKALKKQRADLLNAYKKQLFLIDNLKRQNLCMEQSRMIAFGEKEFTKVLDWQSKN